MLVVPRIGRAGLVAVAQRKHVGFARIRHVGAAAGIGNFGGNFAAAREIKGLIGTSVDKVEQGTRMVANAGATMQEIVASVQRVNDIIGEISASASDQSDGIGQVNGAVTQLDHMTQQNAALVEQSAAAAESLKEQAHQLSHMVATFKLEPALAGR